MNPLDLPSDDMNRVESAIAVRMTNPKDYIGQYFTAIHPDMFRIGMAALITDVLRIEGVMCFQLRYPDGAEDYTPVENEDFVGKGGLGVFYNITTEEPSV